MYVYTYLCLNIVSQCMYVCMDTSVYIYMCVLIEGKAQPGRSEAETAKRKELFEGMSMLRFGLGSIASPKRTGGARLGSNLSPQVPLFP